MSLLLSQLGYFGRAESWCAARLLADFDATRLNSVPGSATGQESVRVLAADPESWNGWSFKDRKIVPPDPKWNLLAETADLHLERWSDPPGSKWVTYSRPYAATGHGGNAKLKGCDPKHFLFSILQRVSPDMLPEDVIKIETNWKQRLHTRGDFGLNDN